VIDEKQVAVASAAASGVPDGWRVVRFGDVVRNVDVSVRQPLEQGLERFVGLEHLDPESLHIKRWGLIEEGTSFTRKFMRGQVLFGKRRAYQRKAAVAEFDGICSGDILVFEPKGDELLPELLPFIVQSDGFFEHALGTSAGSLSPRTKWSDLARYEFALPPKEEQHRIADILWSVDENLSKGAQVLDDLEITRRSITHKFLTTGFNNKPLKDSKLFGSIPKNWVEKTLEEVCLQITDGEHVTPPRTSEGVYLLSARNVLNGRISLEDVDYISYETYERLCRRVKPEANDILISCSGTIGRVCKVPKGLKFSLVRSVAILKPNSEVESDYLEMCLQSDFLQRQISVGTAQLAQGNLFQGAIRKLVIPMPSIDEQIQIASVVKQFSATRSVWMNHMETTRELRKSLLKSFLTSKSQQI
jgi:type I restriction enzyme S subunit